MSDARDPWPPTRRSLMPPMPASPWHAAQFSANSCLPCVTVPLPSGSPRPSGRTSMSQRAISSGLAGLPKSLAAAERITAQAMIVMGSACLRQDIANLPRLVDAPRLLGVVVKQSVGTHRRDERVAVRLDIAFLVGRPADDLRRLAVPDPVHLKTGLSFRKHRPIQSRILPAPSAVRTDFDLPDFPLSAPRHSRNAIVAWPNLHCTGGIGDHRVRLHPELELPGFTVGEQLSVAGGLPSGHPRLVAEFEPAQPLDVQIALETWQDQPDGETMRWPEGLAVLPVGDDGFIDDLLGQGDTASDAGGVTALGEHPCRCRILSDEFEDPLQRHPRPFVRAHQSMRVLHRDVGIGFLPVLPTVAGAFQEGDTRHGRHRPEIIDRKHQLLAHHAVDQKPMFGGIEVGNAGVAALVVQIRGSDAADELLQRRFRVDRISRIDVAASGAGLWYPADLHVLRPGAEAAQVRTRLARRNIRKRLRRRVTGDRSACEGAHDGKKAPPVEWVAGVRSEEHTSE